MTAADFRRIALSPEGRKSSCMQDYGLSAQGAVNLFRWLRRQGAAEIGCLRSSSRRRLCRMRPRFSCRFLAAGERWGTHNVRLAASEDVRTGALGTAWKLRMDKNAKTSRKQTNGRGAAESEIKNVGSGDSENRKNANHE